MADFGVTQYIGARYVPKFYQNSSGTAAWTANTLYEPLTIVTRNGNSYTSKKPVPAEIGAPENNPEYWVATGIFNEQVESIRQQILQAEEDFTEGLATKANRRRFVLIGDSYGVGIAGQNVSNVPGWGTNFKEIMGLSDDDCFMNFENSTGFIGYVSDTFTTLVNNVTVTDPESITDIVVAGGRNDEGAALDTTSLNNAMNGFYSAAKTRFPNAKVWLCYCGCQRNRETNMVDKLLNVRSVYEGNKRFVTIPEAATALNSDPGLYGNDTTHFNANGYKGLGYWIANGVCGGTPINAKGFSQAALTALNDTTPPANIAYRVFGEQFMWMSESTFTIQVGATKPTGGTPFEFASVANPIFGGYNYSTCAVTTFASVRKPSGFITAACSVGFRRGNMFITINNGNPSGSGYVDLTDVTSIYIPSNCFIFPAATVF